MMNLASLLVLKPTRINSKRQHGLQATLKHAINKTVVEVEPFGIHLFAIWYHSRPARRKTIGVEAGVSNQIEILWPYAPHTSPPSVQQSSGQLQCRA